MVLHRDAQVTVYERNDNISFLSCGIALHVQGVVKDPAGLFYCSPEKLAELGVKTCMRHEVTEVDLTGKKLRVRDLESGKDFEDTFDKLIVTSGSWPVEPPIENAKLQNVMMCKNYAHAMEIVKQCRSGAEIGRASCRERCRSRWSPYH